VIASLLGLVGSVGATWATTAAQVGAIVLAPWLAVLAFELGITAGVALSVLTALAYSGRGWVGPSGDELTWLGTATRLVPLVAVALGAAWIGARLRSSEAAYRLLIEELPLATYIEAPDGASSYVGPQIEAMTGYPAAEWLGGGLFPRVLHPSDRDRVLAAQQEARRAGEPLTHDYRIVTEADEVRWMREESVAVRGRDGRAIYRQGFVTDITDRKQATVRLERELVLRQALIDASIDAICLTTQAGDLVLGNMPMARLSMELELPMQGPVQERLLAIADRMTEPDRYRETIRRIAADADTPNRDEFELRGGRFFQGFVSPVVTDEGTFLGRIWTLREVTEERRLERQQQNFVASVSHELRTPLTSILGYTDLLGETLDRLEAKPQRYLAVIARNAVRLQILVDELLFVAQVDAGRFELDLSEIELADVVAASYEEAVPLAAAGGIDLSLSIDARPTLTADPVRLAQAIDNLVSNAIKFTLEGGKIELRVSSSAGSATIAVADTGIGIPHAEQGRIGERFFRSSTAGERAIGGTGLGMAIVKMIADAHHGRVQIESEPEQGTTVTLELPRLRK
jgi:PAS domain S-box-containing protein